VKHFATRRKEETQGFISRHVACQLKSGENIVVYRLVDQATPFKKEKNCFLVYWNNLCPAAAVDAVAAIFERNFVFF
jgi:hypothetical protein